MTFSEFFIKHPRFAGVVAIVMVLMGLIALFLLPISQYPQVTPPQIVVTATYPGANAQLLVDTVAVPIENQINGVDGMLYMSSTATDNGTYQLTITFNVGTDPDIAQVKVENRLEQVKALLPAIVNQEGLNVKVQSSNMLAFLVLDSPNGTYDSLFLSNFAYSSIQNPLKRIDGISDVNIFGPQKSVRIWVNPRKLTSMGLTTQNVVEAVENQNVVAGIGSIGSAPMAGDKNVVLALTTKGMLENTTDFEKIIVHSAQDGSVVYLKDIARVESGADNYQLSAQFNGHSAVVMELNQAPNSNALSVMRHLKQTIKELVPSFPEDIDLKIAYDSTDFVKASIFNIVLTLVLTFILVVIVVYVFLQNAHATLIPMITIPVSLIATFAVLYAIGFNLNILTLFAMILAIGLVVDDAIVVVERVQYLMQYEHMDSMMASIQAMKDISSSIIATTLVLLSIFVPVAMMAGITGKIYSQFAVTIATAIVFSSVNALTLSPALCAILLKQKKMQKISKVFSWFNIQLDKMKDAYLKCVGVLCNHLKSMAFCCLGVFIVLGLLFKIIPNSFIPNEDQGFILGNVQLPDTASINETQSYLKEISEKVVQMDGVAYMIGIAGTSMLSAGGENIGMIAIGLKPWNQRKSKSLSIEAITQKLVSSFSHECRASVEFFEMPAIPGVGTSGGLSFQVNAVNNGISPKELAEKVSALLDKMNHNQNFSYAFTTFTAETPHLYIDLDRTKLESYGVATGSLFNVLQNNLGSKYVNNITQDGQINKVIVQAESIYRNEASDVEDLYVPNVNNNPIQIGEFIDFKTVLSPKIIYRFNQYLSAAITAAAAPGISSGHAILEIKKLMQTLGNQYAVAWTGLSLQEVEASGLVYILVALAIVFTYLFLVAQYESWKVPLSVMSTNIFAILGALLGLKFMGLPLSIYAQLGIVLLIGLASKNAILIVQFILDAQKMGMKGVKAALYGAKERYRAVLMTALTFILGVFPMVVAKGAGAASQISIGVTVFFGMLAATVIGIVFVPALFLFFDKLGASDDTQKKDH